MLNVVRITSSANPRFKSAVRLRDGRARRRAGQFLVDGEREFVRAVASGIPLVAAFLHDAVDPAKSPALQQITADRADGSESGMIFQLAEHLFRQLAYGDRDAGLVGVFRSPERPLDDFHPPSEPLLVVLDRLEKPGNIGAVFRCADAAGAAGVLLSDCGTDLFNPNTIRASAGTVFGMPTAVAPGTEVRAWLARQQIRCLVTRVDAVATHWQSDWRGGVAMILGNEAEGLGPEWSGGQVEGVRIPMAGIADSLNASVTAAVCLYEAVRQRRGA